MRKASLKLLSITILLILITASQQAAASLAIQTDLSGTVSYVHDGDTLDINNGNIAIRLADIDAPETGETGYNDAKWFLYNLVYGKTVYLDKSTLNGQSYDRLVCVVYVDYDSQYYMNVNQKMIESGYAKKVDYSNDFKPDTWTLLVPKNTQPTDSQTGFRTDMLLIAGFTLAIILVAILLLASRQPKKRSRYRNP